MKYHPVAGSAVVRWELQDPPLLSSAAMRFSIWSSNSKLALKSREERLIVSTSPSFPVST
jgi:hypothetical protein